MAKGKANAGEVSITTGNKRLLKLAAFLERLPRKKFDFSLFTNGPWDGSPNSCGTTGCALGWAATMPEFRRLGLRVVPYAYEAGYAAIRFRGDTEPFTAAAELFVLSEGEAFQLFSPADADLDGQESYLGPDATPKQVAKHLRKFVKARGGAPTAAP